MDAIARFAEHVIATDAAAIPASAMAAAKAFMLDTIGVGLVGSSGPMAHELAVTHQALRPGR